MRLLPTVSVFTLGLLLAGCGDKDADDSSTTDDTSVSSDDEDGDGVTVADGDCDDSDPTVSPNATETPYDGVDNDCNEATPDDDLDGDSFNQADDCDDNNANINPGANEICDEIDNNCDGSVDEGATDTFYQDSDGDGYGSDDVTQEACAAPTGYVEEGGDCDDGDTAYNPGATENDCTDPNDYNCDGSVGAVDSDGDGFFACEECDDTDATAFPGGTEVCDDVDNDCDGTVDDGVTTTFYRDADSDSYGDPDSTQEDCSAPSGYVSNDEDCDDTDGNINPDADDDYPDGVDDDCDGTADDEVPSYTSSDIQSIINSSCAGCHTSGGTSGGLNMDSFYSSTVNVRSGGVSTMDYIEPGDTATSYIWHKLNGTQSSVGGSGSRMPRNGSMSSSDLQTIEIWILTGATQ
ncbi:MAG: hypothetical protein H6739_00215 [Alphaproteobacteria bacterium]|nr:hypothetical protein [Alphaproteobacteria bacterium]